MKLKFWQQPKKDLTELEKQYNYLEILTTWHKTLQDCYTPLTEQVIDRSHERYLEARRDYERWLRRIDKLEADFLECEELLDVVLRQLERLRRGNNG